jgi:peptide/nickel transport system permease protein
MNRPLLRLIVARLLLSLLSLLAVSVIVFGVMEALPGDTAQRMLGRDATVQSLAVLRAELHLERPASERYSLWLVGVLHGDFGNSLVARRPVLPYIAGHFGHSLLLAGIALALHVPLAISLGLLGAASRRDGAVDTAISAAALLGMSVPEFVIGILLVAILATTLGWFPPLALIDQAHTPLNVLRTLFLPVLTLNTAMTAYVLRQTRNAMFDVLRSDYVRMATLRGLPRWHVLLRHALPNALAPAINAIALNSGWLVGGVVVIEVVFNYPGLGRLLVESISFHDVPMILGAALVLSATYISINLLADVATMLLTPKLRVR